MKDLTIKVIVVFICISLFFTLGTNAQPCTPNQSYTIPGVYPDSIPHAYVDSAYLTVLNFRSPPKDTVIGSLPAVVDSIKVLNISGLPAGFTYQ